MWHRSLASTPAGSVPPSRVRDARNLAATLLLSATASWSAGARRWSGDGAAAGPASLDPASRRTDLQADPHFGWLWQLLGGLLLALLLTLPFAAAPAWAADLRVSEVRLEPCPAEDAGSQPELRRPSGASCYALRGLVTNPGRQTVVDTDVFALILDSSGEPVLPNRSRVGSIGDVPPGDSEFALRLAVPAGTPGPFEVRNPRARGFKAPVRSRAAEGDELLPLEEAVSPG